MNRNMDGAESIPSPLSEVEDGLKDDDHGHGHDPDHADDYDFDFDDDQDNRPNFKLLGRKAESVLKHVEKGRLRSFRLWTPSSTYQQAYSNLLTSRHSWHLGTCIPLEILGLSGIVSLNQPSLTSLSLITDPKCEEAHDDRCDIDLSSFRLLQSLSWKGPNAEHLGSLSFALLSNAEILRKITLDFMNWPDLAHDLGYETDEEVETSDYFLRSILKFNKRSPSPLFPKLRLLSLSQVPLGKAMARVTDFSTLSSLTLRQCPDWHEFLEEVLKLKQPIHLRSLETQTTLGDSARLGELALRDLLTSFKGLQELYISEAGALDTIELWQRVAIHHRASLRKFVYHQRAVNVDEDSPLFGGEHDLPDLGISGHQMRHIKEDDSRNPLADLDLECLGLSCTPERLVSNWSIFKTHDFAHTVLQRYLLRPFVPKTSLRLLHIRQTNFDIRSTASLAFKGRHTASETDSETGGLEAGESQDPESLSPWPDSDSQSEFGEGSHANDGRVVDWYTAGILGKLRKEFVQFAKWIFSPQGVASLQIVAFGDFAHGRFYQESIMLCRDPDSPMNFRGFDVHSTECKRILDEHRDVLGSCPVQPLLGEPLV